MRIVVRLAFASLNHINRGNVSLAMAKPRARLDVSQQGCVGETYFFFFLPVFFFAFFAFLAKVPSVIPKLSSTQVEHRHA